jgi:PAS domain S-box-containing protein
MGKLIYLVPYITSLVISIAVLIYAWRRRSVIGATAFAFLALGQVVWTFGYILELLNPTLEGKVIWDNFQFFGGAIYVLAVFGFALEYTGHRLLLEIRSWAFLITISVVLIVIAYTDSWHGLARPNTMLIHGEPFSELTYDFSLFFWIGYIYSFVLLVGGIYLLSINMAQSSPMHRGQSILVIIGILIPLVGITLTMFGITLTFHRDTTPLTFAIANLVLVFALFRFRFLDIVPVARNAIFENMNDIVCVLDIQHRIIDANPASQQITGLTHKEVVGFSFDQVCPKIFTILSQRPIDKQDRFEINLGSDNNDNYYELNISPLYTRRGRIIGRLIIAHDINAMKNAEAEILKHSLQLAEANKELESFSHSISHDLRAPLRAVDGYAKILLEDYQDALDKDGQEFLARLRKSTARMGRMIEALLSYSRLSQQPIEKSTISPTYIAHQTWEELGPSHEGRQLEITIDEMPICQADPTLIHQVYINLLDNALKFTSKRDLAQIHVGCQSQDGESVYFVKDNGEGFDLAHADKLFGMFQRLHREDDFEGTGIGLANVHRIIHRHGGRIWADAELDKGATFFFTLSDQKVERLHSVN